MIEKWIFISEEYAKHIHDPKERKKYSVQGFANSPCPQSDVVKYYSRPIFFFDGKEAFTNGDHIVIRMDDVPTFVINEISAAQGFFNNIMDKS